MRLSGRFLPDTLEGRIVGILVFSFVLLLAAVISVEVADRRSAVEWAELDTTFDRLKRMHTVLESIPPNRRPSLLASVSVCHEGYTLSGHRYPVTETTARTEALRKRIAEHLMAVPQNVAVGHVRLTRDDFSYAACPVGDIGIPMPAVVVSVRLRSGEWFNAEVHPHEWHVRDFVSRVLGYSAVFLLIATGAIAVVRQLSRPLNSLTEATRRFSEGLEVSTVDERGPPDLRRAIQSFNAMQRQVAEDVKKRTDTLAAIGHDLRTPLTALRIRAELVEDRETREGLVKGILKMEAIVASALEYLRGESRSEPMRQVDLSTMIANECRDFREAGQRAEFVGVPGVRCTCRPDALMRAVRNLIENANKYGDGATVNLRKTGSTLELSVSDSGPGIPAERLAYAIEPFQRLSAARENNDGGFGLGLAIVKVVAEGHGGQLVLAANEPSGLVATIRIPDGQVSE